MKTYSLYKKATGLFTGVKITASESVLAMQLSDELSAVEGSHDERNTRVDLSTGKVVEWNPPAPSETEFHSWSWNEEERLWFKVPKPALMDQEARIKRSRLLLACDWVVARAQELEEPIPEEWRAYRSALRDVTKQEGFPISISWPTEPSKG